MSLERVFRDGGRHLHRANCAAREDLHQWCVSQKRGLAPLLHGRAQVPNWIGVRDMISIVDYGSRSERALSACALLLLLLPACGDAQFTADPLTLAGAGGITQTPQGVSGGAGTSAAGSSSVAQGGGSAGTPAVVAEAAGASCLSAWEGSTCDTCTSFANPPGSRTCQTILDCFVTNGCTASTCYGRCAYVGPTADAAVNVAVQVSTCLCGAP